MVLGERKRNETFVVTLNASLRSRGRVALRVTAGQVFPVKVYRLRGLQRR